MNVVKALSTLAIVSCWCLFLSGNEQLKAAPIFTDDFEAGASSEWSNTITDTTPVGGRKFLGQLGTEIVSLSLTGLSPHTQVSVSFDLFIIQSWDGTRDPGFGPDRFQLRVFDGPTLLDTTFANVGFERQNYPDPFVGVLGTPDNPPQTGAAEVNTLGYAFFGDSVYNLAFTFAHASSSLRLDFEAEVFEGIANESWGLDNVAVSLDADASVVPEPSAFALFAAGVIGLISYRWRKRKLTV